MAMEARMARRGMMEIQQLSKGDGFLRYGYRLSVKKSSDIGVASWEFADDVYFLSGGLRLIHSLSHYLRWVLYIPGG